MSKRIAEEVSKLAIGKKIRTLRERRGLSLAQVAERTSMPEVLLARIEQDEIAPTVAALVNVAGALDTTVDTFFQDKPFTDRIEVVRAGEGREVKRTQQPDEGRLTYQYESLAYRLAGKHMEPFLVEFSLDTDEPARPMTHDGEEFLYIMEGDVEFISGDDRVVLHPGDSIYFYSKTPHQLRGVGTVTPKAIAVLYPYAGGPGGTR